MTIEDDFLAELNDYEHRISEERRQKEEAIVKHNEAIRFLISLNIPKEEISQRLGISIVDINSINN